jgi:hypothetical protein
MGILKHGTKVLLIFFQEFHSSVVTHWSQDVMRVSRNTQVGFTGKQQVEVWQAMKQSLCLLEGISRIGGRIIVAQIGTSSSKKGRT